MKDKNTYPNIPEYEEYMQQKDEKREKTPDGSYDPSISIDEKLQK